MRRGLVVGQLECVVLTRILFALFSISISNCNDECGALWVRMVCSFVCMCVFARTAYICICIYVHKLLLVAMLFCLPICRRCFLVSSTTSECLFLGVCACVCVCVLLCAFGNRPLSCASFTLTVACLLALLTYLEALDCIQLHFTCHLTVWTVCSLICLSICLSVCLSALLCLFLGLFVCLSGVIVNDCLKENFLNTTYIDTYTYSYDIHFLFMLTIRFM